MLLLEKLIVVRLLTKKHNKTIVYSSKTYPMTDADHEKFEKDIQAERTKHDRDMKCGGIDECGNYTALYHRWEEQ